MQNCTTTSGSYELMDYSKSVSLTPSSLYSKDTYYEDDRNSGLYNGLPFANFKNKIKQVDNPFWPSYLMQKIANWIKKQLFFFVDKLV